MTKQKEGYIAIEDLPKSNYGRNPIPQDFIDSVKVIPEGFAKKFDMKVGTATQRIKSLQTQKILSENFKVTQRKSGDNIDAYIKNEKPEPEE